MPKPTNKQGFPPKKASEEIAGTQAPVPCASRALALGLGSGLQPA